VWRKGRGLEENKSSRGGQNDGIRCQSVPSNMMSRSVRSGSNETYPMTMRIWQKSPAQNGPEAMGEPLMPSPKDQ
jgi:hypothetical protein